MTRTIVTQIPQTAQEAQMKLEVVGRLLETHFPTTLSARPLSGTLVLSYLVFQRRRKDEHRNSFHAIGFVEVSIDLM